MKGKLKKTGTKDRISYLYISHGAIRHSSERITTETDVEFGYLMMPTEAKIKIGTKIRREVERGSNLFCLFYVGDFARGYANRIGEYMAYGSGCVVDAFLFLNSDRSELQTIGGIYIYTTFLTSLILWLMTPSLLVVRLYVNSAKFTIPYIKRYIDLDKHVFLVVGGFSILLYSIAYMLWKVIS